jgi:hypothetical protein
VRRSFRSRRLFWLLVTAAAAVGVAWAVYRTGEPGGPASRAPEESVPPPATPRRRAPPAPPEPSAPGPGSEAPHTGIAALLGPSLDPTPPNYRGSPSAWRMHQGITREECARVLQAYKSLSAEDRKHVTMDVIRHPSPDLRQPLLDAVAVSDAVPVEAVLLSIALVKLIEKAPLDEPPADTGAAHGPTDAQLAATVVTATSRMLKLHAGVVSDATWRPVTENLRKLRDRGLVGPETPGLAELRRSARTALSGLTEPTGAFAAGPGVFQFASQWPDLETVDLLIATTEVFQKHRSRLSPRPDVDRACLTYVCGTVTASGTLEQVARYVAVLDSLDWDAMKVETRRSMRERLYILRRRADLDVATRDHVTRILDRTSSR